MKCMSQLPPPWRLFSRNRRNFKKKSKKSQAHKMSLFKIIRSWISQPSYYSKKVELRCLKKFRKTLAVFAQFFEKIDFSRKLFFSGSSQTIWQIAGEKADWSSEALSMCSRISWALLWTAVFEQIFVPLWETW